MNSLWSVLLFAFFPNTVQNPFSALRCCQTSRPRKEWLAEKPHNLMQENLKKQASHADACLCSNSSLEISNDNETLELCSLFCSESSNTPVHLQHIAWSVFLACCIISLFDHLNICKPLCRYFAKTTHRKTTVGQIYLTQDYPQLQRITNMFY